MKERSFKGRKENGAFKKHKKVILIEINKHTGNDGSLRKVKQSQIPESLRTMALGRRKQHRNAGASCRHVEALCLPSIKTKETTPQSARDISAE